jgi:D-alanyl-D-alanine carboxypeptidase
MTSSKGFYVGLILLFAGVLAVAGFKFKAVGQAAKISSAKAAPAAKPAAEKTAAESATPASLPTVAHASNDAVPAASAGAAFQAAALKNARLESDLTWAFGGKSQRGWSLYAPLISSVIGAEGDARSDGFAAALSRWQKDNGLEADGVLDSSTWSEMVSWFQSRRIKDRTYPSAEQLVTAAPDECYDPSRAEALRKVERQTYMAYKRMIAAAAADPASGLKVTATGELDPSEKYLKIISAFRSREYQDHLRKQSPNSGRAGLAVNSPHFTGRALDIYVGGEPVSTKDDNRAIQVQTRAYKWLVKNAARFGFRPYFYEPWHWEYVPNN